MQVRLFEQKGIIPKVLVHLHLYYHEQIDYFINKLKNINSCDWDLYVTVIENNKKSESKILKLKHNACIIKVENNGYDVWPFIQIIRSLNLNNYNYVLKLHTKNLQIEKKFGDYGYHWRDILVDALLKSEILFRENLEILKNNIFGMICCFETKYDMNYHLNVAENSYLFEDECRRIGFLSKSREICAGTMFFVRADILKFLQTIDLDASMFAGRMETNSKASLAHVYERILCIAVSNFGYETFWRKLSKKEKLKILFKKLFYRVIS